MMTKKCIASCLFLLCFSIRFINANSSLAHKAYDNIKWIDGTPQRASFIHMYGHTSQVNPQLAKQLKHAHFAKVINVYDRTLQNAGIPVRPGLSLKGTQQGVDFEITKRIGHLDHLLIKKSNHDVDHAAHEVLQFRLHTNKGTMVTHSIEGSHTGVSFPQKLIAQQIAHIIKTRQQMGEQIIGLEIIHNHPVQAIEFFDHNKKSLGYFYNPFSTQDIKVGNQFKKYFSGLPIELAIIVGLERNDLFRVSYYPKA